MADLNDMTLKELKALRRDIDEALEEFDDKNKKSAFAAAQAAVAAFGIALHDLLPWVNKSKAKAPRTALPAKYANPQNPSQTWSGRGRKPGWIKEGEADGRDLSEFAI